MSRRSAKVDPLSGLLFLVFLASILAFVALTDSWSILGIAPGGRLQFFGRGTVTHRALTATSNEFGSRDFRVKEGDVVTVRYKLTGETGKANLFVSLCGFNPLDPNCSILRHEPLSSTAQGSFQVPIPRAGRCDVDLWVKDYLGTVELSWETR